MKKINSILLAINLVFLQLYLIRFNLGPYPTNLQEILIALNVLTLIFSNKNHILKNLQTPIKALKNLIQKHWIITIFGILTLISIAFLPEPDTLTFLRHLKFLFFAGILSLVFIEIFKSEKERIQGLNLLSIGAIAFGIFSIFYNLAGYNPTFDSRLLGPLDSAVYLAYYLAPCLIFSLTQFFENPKNKKYLATSIALGALLIATKSMGALGGVIIVQTLYLLRNHAKKILASKIAKFSLLAIILLVSASIFYTKILPTFQTTYSSLDERGEIWKTSAHLLKEPKNLILGVGIGQFEHYYIENVNTAINNNPLDYFVIQPHNIFLLFIFQYGILGLIFLLYLMLSIAKNLFNSKITNTKTIAGMMICYFFIHGIIDTPFFKNDLLILLILFLQLALPRAKSASSNH